MVIVLTDRVNVFGAVSSFIKLDSDTPDIARPESI